MTDHATDGHDHEDNAKASRADLPVTQVDDDEVASHDPGGDAPDGQGVGIAGGTTPHADAPAEGTDEERRV
ncbi:hypothetical protein [Agromyces larvae]|uniref:Multidrug transporter n=1 Tax=Agromyces larvae TaxID=2929802 RepID=A0ABY4BVX0_9MICO|nr:hypothetical protein [Agromyces larvae]UOE42899.1 hypothetical protein MTO99_11945 [Agromyces larvae]